ncbi:SET domain-containing protein [Phytophthora infestans]|uniref:SET domain-containing protein n=1 Tax=Phytophthora infestans TaxID=4787 RepID=A0A833WFQ4_PHYIN|nr:SET domain-containing protein [Phytophthora infestans]KAI9993713.1 hypothetical protein PInf_016011 [Phytophthora infestans]KAI9994264.1 hypothetical protein PInf_016833 [Phytophthora infestans]
MGKTAGHKAAGCSQEQGREVGMDATVKKELAAEATATAKGVQTYNEREDKKKRMKNNPWKTSSRKLRYRGHKNPVRTSTKVYIVGKMKAMYMNSFLRLPGAREALSARRNAVLRHEATPRKPEVIVIDDDGDDLWSMGVDKVSVSRNPEKIKFPDTGPTDKCKCAYDCFRDDCLNADTSFYCTAANCNREGNCLNSLYECKNLELTVCKGTGIGVKATATIHAGSIIGNYTGVLITHNFAADEEQTCDYALELRLKSTRGKKVYIDATSCGGITRMLNHSCDAPCHFVELRNRENVAVVVVAKRTIEDGEEVTVDYVDPWFDCVCGAANCRG